MPAPAPEAGRIAGTFAVSYTDESGQLREKELGPGTAVTSMSKFTRDIVPGAAGGGVGHTVTPVAPFIQAEFTTKRAGDRNLLLNFAGGTVVFVTPTNEHCTLTGAVIKSPGPQEDWTTGLYPVTFEGTDGGWDE